MRLSIANSKSTRHLFTIEDWGARHFLLMNFQACDGKTEFQHNVLSWQEEHL
jgi:hypothetical protein